MSTPDQLSAVAPSAQNGPDNAKRLSRASWTALAILLAVFFIFPLVWLVIATFKRHEDLFAFILLPGDPSRLTLANYVDLFQQQPIAQWLVNSMFISGIGAAVQVTLSSLCGYALARYSFHGKSFITVLMLCVMALPFQVMLPASYELMRNIGWVNTYYAVMIPGAVSVFGTLMFRQAFAGLPNNVLEAARIDGCGEWHTWWSIGLPMVQPTTAALLMMSFLGSWNSLLWPSVMLQEEIKFPVTVSLANMNGLREYQSNIPLLLTATLIAVIPPAAVFLLCQKEFISGLTAGVSSDE